MRPQHTLSTFNFRSLPRAVDSQRRNQPLHSHRRHYCHPPQPSQCQAARLPVTTSAHGLHQQPCYDVSSVTTSAQVYIHVQAIVHCDPGDTSTVADFHSSDGCQLTLYGHIKTAEQRTIMIIYTAIR